MMDDSMGNMDTAKMETFWGKTLSSKNKVFEFEEEEEGLETTIQLRGACLGYADNMNSKERNIIAVTVENEDDEEERFVIASLRLDGVEQVPLNLSIQPPAKFELLKGSGPVHLTGAMTTEMSMSDYEDESDDEEEEETAKESVPPVLVPAKSSKPSALKRPADDEPSKKKPKAPKLEDEEDQNDDSLMDSKDSKDNAIDGDSGDSDLEGEDSDDDDIEEGSDEDEMESDELDSDLDDSEEEEEVKVPPTKKGKKPQAGNKKAQPVPPAPAPAAGKKEKPKGNKTTSLTPQPTKNSKPAGKTPLSSQKPPKSQTPNKGPMNIDLIKKKLVTGTTPKKLEKFNNFLTHTYKVTDPETRKQLWEYVQQNKK